MTMTNTDNKQQNTLASLYAVLFVLTAASLMPYPNVAVLGTILFLFVFIALYVFKAKAEEGDLLHNHTTYLIRSIWISSLLLILGIAFFFFAGDHFVMTQMMEDVAQTAAMPTEEDLHLLSQQYLQDNISILTLSFAPGLIYFLYRLCKGAARAVKGYRIQNPKGWL